MRGADRVYVARTPLVGFESARNAVLKLPLSPRIRSSFESLCDRHVLVVVERESLASDEGRFTSFDFLPVAPTDPETMAKMAFNRPTLGEVRIRSLKGRALSSWSMKGEAPDCIERATEFSKGYDLSISLFGNSCEDYATQLVAHLLVE